MANVTLTTSNFRKGIYKNLRTSILNVSVIQAVYAAYPLKNAVFPCVVIENASKGATNKAMNDSTFYKEATAIVTIYSKQAETLDTYTDSIEAQLESDKNTLYTTYNMYISNIMDNDGASFIDADNNRIHAKSMSVMIELK
jgi:hypothetical protein